MLEKFSGTGSSEKLETTCRGMENLLSCYLAETKTVTWNGCLGARSCEYASFPELCKNQTIAGFLLAEAVSPVPIPEELMQSA